MILGRAWETQILRIRSTIRNLSFTFMTNGPRCLLNKPLYVVSPFGTTSTTIEEILSVWVVNTQAVQESHSVKWGG